MTVLHEASVGPDKAFISTIVNTLFSLLSEPNSNELETLFLFGLMAHDTCQQAGELRKVWALNSASPQA